MALAPTSRPPRQPPRAVGALSASGAVRRTLSQQGQTFSRDLLASAGGLTTLNSADVTAISKLNGVAGASRTLNLTSIHVTGTFGAGPTGPGGTSGSGSASSFNVSTFTVDGVDADNPGLGPLSASNITAGTSAVAKWFDRVPTNSSSSDQPLALVDSSYAKQNSLKAGSPVVIAGGTFKVLGVVSLSPEASSADVYVPLSEAQKLASDTSKVNTIYVKADSSSDISKVQAEIQNLMPKVTVTTAQDLANQVSGSLSTAASLADSLGIWLAAAVLLAAFVLAALLTTASVTGGYGSSGPSRPWGGTAAGSWARCWGSRWSREWSEALSGSGSVCWGPSWSPRSRPL